MRARIPIGAKRCEVYTICYAAEDNGHLRAHRDNSAVGTAHRRFADSVNLNVCSLPHEVSPVAAGGATPFCGPL